MSALRTSIAYTLGAAMIVGQVGMATAAPLPTHVAAMKSVVADHLSAEPLRAAPMAIMGRRHITDIPIRMVGTITRMQRTTGRTTDTRTTATMYGPTGFTTITTAITGIRITIIGELNAGRVRSDQTWKEV